MKEPEGVKAQTSEGHGTVKIASKMPPPFKKAGASAVEDSISTNVMITKIKEALENGQNQEAMSLAFKMVCTCSRDLPTDLAQRIYLVGLKEGRIQGKRIQGKRTHDMLDMLAKKLSGEISQHEHGTLYSVTVNAGYPALAQAHFS